MVNFGLNSASILGIFLAVAGAGLYFLRSVRPELSRDHDIFFAAVGLLCGFILLFQGWRLDPILQFGQFLLTGAAIFFATETIRLRGATTEQVRRNRPIVDDERPVSNVYRADLVDQIEAYDDEEQNDNRRLRGYQDSRSSRRSAYEEDEPRNYKRRGSSESYGSRESNRPRRPRPSSSSKGDRYENWQETSDHWDERPSSSRPRRSRSDGDFSEPVPRKPARRSSRPSEGGMSSRRDEDAIPTDYVDYQPLDQTETGSSDWEQPEKPERNRERGDNEDNAINFDY